MNFEDSVRMLVVAAVLGFFLGGFASQAKSFVRALTSPLGELVRAGTQMATGALDAIWSAVKPIEPLPPLDALIGLLLIVGACIVISANYRQLAPTIAFLIPAEGVPTALTLALVVLGTSLGSLFHALPSHRRVFAGLGLLLVLCVGVLNWKRAELVLDEPDIGSLALATLFPVLLQVAEMSAVFGALRLAGPALPLVAALPLLAGLGALSAVARIFAQMRLDEALGSAADAVIGAAEHLFNGLRRVSQWLSPTAFGNRRQARRVLRVRQAAEVRRAERAVEFELERGRIVRDAEEQRQRDDADHRRALDQLRHRIKTENSEAELRAEGAGDSQILAAARSRKIATASNVIRKYFDTVERVALDVIDESAQDIRADALSEVRATRAEPAGSIAEAVREVFRTAGYFRASGATKNHNEHDVDRIKTTLN